MLYQTALVSCVIPVIIVDDKACYEPADDTDELIRGTTIKNVNIPVYCDIIIKLKNGKQIIKTSSVVCLANPKIRMEYVHRRHILLNNLKDEYFIGKIRIGTENGSITSDCIRINIGHINKTSENRQYCRELYYECKAMLNTMSESDAMITDTVVPEINPELKNTLKVIVSNYPKIQANIKFKTCMETIQLMLATSIRNEPESNETIAAYNMILLNFKKYQTDDEFRTYMDAIHIASKSNSTDIELHDALTMIMKHIAQHENSKPELNAVHILMRDLF